MIIRESSELEKMVKILDSQDKNPIAIDTETNFTDSYADRSCLGISIATKRSYFYIPVGHKPVAGMMPQQNFEGDLTKIFSNLTAPIIMHNAKFDLHVLNRMGIYVPTGNLYDTMIMSHLIDENPKWKGDSPHSLETLSKRFSSIEKNVALAKIMKEAWESSVIEGMAKYAQEDAVATLEVFNGLWDSFGPYIDCWHDYDRDFLLVLKNIEEKGIRLDADKCLELETLCLKRMQEIRDELGFNPGSSNILQEKFFAEPPVGLGLSPISKTGKGKPQINKGFLEQVNHPLAGLILEYRGLQKQASSYFRNYLDLAGSTGRLHPSFKQTGTVTGRLSCENPNLQQVPRDSDVKKMFLPEDEKQLWEIDFRNLELRLTAVYSQEPNLLNAFHEERDIHQEVADQVGVTRQMAKIVNFLITYGGGESALSTQAKIPLSEARNVRNDYKRTYPGIFKAMYQAQATAEDTGSIRMFSGRHRHFSGMSKGDAHKAFNAVIQGGGFEIVKRSMIKLHKAGVDIRNQVHDSVWINVDNEEQVIEAEHIMADWTKDAFGLMFSVDRKRLR